MVSRPMRGLVLCLIAAAAALLAPSVAASKSHGGGGTWRVPVNENKAWKKYK
jgi:hypothetical protein